MSARQKRAHLAGLKNRHYYSFTGWTAHDDFFKSCWGASLASFRSTTSTHKMTSIVRYDIYSFAPFCGWLWHVESSSLDDEFEVLVSAL